MLLLVATVVLAQRDQPLTQKLLKAADAAGWSYAMHGHPAAGIHIYSVSEMLNYNNRYIRVTVDERKDLVAAAFVLQRLKKTKERRIPFDEPQLKGTGLVVDARDYGAKHISNMKAYAVSNLRIFGLVGKSAVFIVSEPPNGREHDPLEHPKPDEQVYGDIVGFANLLA